MASESPCIQLALNFCSSCLSLPSSEIAGMSHIAWHLRGIYLLVLQPWRHVSTVSYFLRLCFMFLCAVIYLSQNTFYMSLLFFLCRIRIMPTKRLVPWSLEFRDPCDRGISSLSMELRLSDNWPREQKISLNYPDESSGIQRHLKNEREWQGRSQSWPGDLNPHWDRRTCGPKAEHPPNSGKDAAFFSSVPRRRELYWILSLLVQWGPSQISYWVVRCEIYPLLGDDIFSNGKLSHSINQPPLLMTKLRLPVITDMQC